MKPEAGSGNTHCEAEVDPTVAGPKPRGCTESGLMPSPLGGSLKPKGRSLDSPLKPEAEGDHQYPEAEGGEMEMGNHRRSAVRVTPGEAGGLSRVVRDEASLLVRDLRISEGTWLTEGVPESFATRVAPGESLKPKAAGLCDEVLAVVDQPEAEGEAEVWYQSRMIRVKEGDQSSVSEIQFRATVQEAPTDNIPPLPVDSHEADISPHFA